MSLEPWRLELEVRRAHRAQLGRVLPYALMKYRLAKAAAAGRAATVEEATPTPSPMPSGSTPAQ